MSKIFTYTSFLITLFLSLSQAIWNVYFKIDLNSWRFSSLSRIEQNIHNVECLSLCSQTTGCETVNHNSQTNICELLKPGPWTTTSGSGDESHWAVYSKDAWQSSTYVGAGENNSIIYHAFLAIDTGRYNSKTGYCAHTNYPYSFWAMEFDHEVEVSHIIVYFLNTTYMNYGNGYADLHFLISDTRPGCDYNVPECGYYHGSQSPLSPVEIVCEQLLTGKFLKITKYELGYPVLCEVEVYTT